MSGQFSPLERKSIEPIALQIEDGNVRAMQRFVSDVVWNRSCFADTIPWSLKTWGIPRGC